MTFGREMLMEAIWNVEASTICFQNKKWPPPEIKH